MIRIERETAVVIWLARMAGGLSGLLDHDHFSSGVRRMSLINNRALLIRDSLCWLIESVR